MQKNKKSYRYFERNDILYKYIWSDIEVVITRLSRKQLAGESWPVGSNPTHSAKNLFILDKFKK